jgi:hypothetical protein
MAGMAAVVSATARPDRGRLLLPPLTPPPPPMPSLLRRMFAMRSLIADSRWAEGAPPSAPLLIERALMEGDSAG